jgi:hypothetical protein
MNFFCAYKTSLQTYFQKIKFLKISQTFGLQATLICPPVHILCMAILGGWVPD